MERNAEIAKYVALRGYPDWAEEVEVDSSLPLDSHEVRLYYLRLNREVGFTRAFILDKPRIGLKSYERPMVAEKRAWIQSVYLAHDPALRAELAAERAMAAAERAEEGAVSVENAVAKAERISSEMERAFHRRLRK